MIEVQIRRPCSHPPPISRWPYEVDIVVAGEFQRGKTWRCPECGAEWVSRPPEHAEPETVKHNPIIEWVSLEQVVQMAREETRKE